jgi:CHC2 zinc finger
VGLLDKRPFSFKSVPDMAEFKRRSFYSRRWGTIRQFPLPNAVFGQGPSLSPCALKVYACLQYSHKKTPRKIRLMYRHPRVSISIKTLEKRTGYQRRNISRAIKELKDKGYIDVVPNTAQERTRKGKLKTQEYILRDPRKSQELDSSTSTNVFYENRVSYFNVPECLVTEHDKRWGMAHLTGSQFILYLALLWMANQCRANEFPMEQQTLRKKSGLSKVIFFRTLDELEDLGLIFISSAKIYLCDPYTGYELLETDVETDDPQNYFIQDAKGRDRRLDLNLNYSDPDSVERFIRDGMGYQGPVIKKGNGNLEIRCPFHPDNTPSLSVSPTKKGCWHCFGGSCGMSGNLFDLAKAFDPVKFRDPDPKAEAIYSYRDDKGKLLYQVLKFRDPDGSKRFQQRRPASGGGWKYSMQGIKRVLYNQHLFSMVKTAMLVEGEKDADTATNLRLKDWVGWDIIGTTSGGATSWEPHMARRLKDAGLRVIVMPDADDAGVGWLSCVIASLTAEGVAFTVVSLAGTGSKDLSEYMAGHSADDLMALCGKDWINPFYTR